MYSVQSFHSIESFKVKSNVENMFVYEFVFAICAYIVAYLSSRINIELFATQLNSHVISISLLM